MRKLTKQKLFNWQVDILYMSIGRKSKVVETKYILNDISENSIPSVKLNIY